MSKFAILEESCTAGFEEHVTLNILGPIEDQLNRKRVVSRKGDDQGTVSDLKDVIKRNASLRISFGWGFESGYQYEQMMEECLNEVLPKYNTVSINMESDMRVSWLGFMPFNMFETAVYDHLGIHELIIFNNDLINFQIDVIKFISKHKCFLQHAFLRNSDYRFHYMKTMRNNPDRLCDAFHYYIDAIKDTIGITTVLRQHLEEQLGCHYLKHPEVFFELLEFYKLKGVVYD